ncbi:hypothetical protein M3Y98_00718800 [Aphelenchoides besseyi]|nr:hypothetical protein M3Y98_00718800 [Aphelenchoides besseyi]
MNCGSFFSDCSNHGFSMTLETHSHLPRLTTVTFLADGESDQKKFKVYIWAEYKGKVFEEWAGRHVNGSKNMLINLNDRIKSRYDYQPFELYCKIVYTNECSLCEVEV